MHIALHLFVRKSGLRATIFVPTVAYSHRTIGIIISSVLAVGCMVVAVLISGPLPFHLFGTANATSTHDLLVQYAAKDTDADGLPDWEEVLYGTDPNNAHTVEADVLDGEAVSKGLVKPKFASATSTPIKVEDLPGTTAGENTVTDQFARALFGQYLAQAGNTPPTPEQIASFVEKAVADLERSQQSADTFTAGQVKVSGAGSDALVTYAASIETVFAKNASSPEKSEVEYLADAVQKNDTAALTQVRKIGATYTTLAKGYVAESVPREAAVPHLAVANALARIGTDITDFGAMDKDPLRAYLGLARYQEDVPKLVAALTALHAVYQSEQVVVPEGTTGAFFYKLLVTSAAQKL